MLCGEKALVSKVPSWRCVTGISNGANSALNTFVALASAEIIADSGRWNAGDKLDIILGVKKRTDGFPTNRCVGRRCGCGSGKLWRSGRKDWRVSIGVRRRVFRRSESVEGESVAIGVDG